MSDLFLQIATAVVHDDIAGLPIETLTNYGVTDTGAPWIENADEDRVTFVQDNFEVFCPKGTYSYGFFNLNLYAHACMEEIRLRGQDYTLGIWVAQTWGENEERAVLMLSINVLDVDHESCDRHLFPIGIFNRTPEDLPTFTDSIRRTLLGN